MGLITRHGLTRILPRIDAPQKGPLRGMRRMEQIWKGQ